MNPYIYCLLLSIFFLIGTLYFVKSRIIDFKYSIFWILISIVFIILSSNKNLTECMAKTVNISYAPAFLFVTGIIFIFFLIFHMTIVISQMQNKITRLIQEIGILKVNVENNDLPK